MAILKILRYPDPILRIKCEPVREVTDSIRELLADMAETMYAAPGVGLAASQIGETVRAIVVDVGEDEETGRKASLYKLLNPEIVSSDGKQDGEEGCLSIPDIRENVVRAANIVVEGLNEFGKKISVEADGILSVCFQHEIDHLNGVLFTDRLSRIKREMIKSRLRELEKSSG